MSMLRNDMSVHWKRYGLFTEKVRTFRAKSPYFFDKRSVLFLQKQ